MTFYYFAYDSNMLTTRLTQRCPGAIVVGLATAADTVVEFSKPSEDKSGKATLRQAVGNRTAGVVFTIPRAERDQLDSCEGVGKATSGAMHSPSTLSIATKSSRRPP